MMYYIEQFVRNSIIGAKQSKKRQQTELERLREENELLQIENEYLKKLRALVQEEENNKRKSSKS